MAKAVTIPARASTCFVRPVKLNQVIASSISFVMPD